jgi:hypothetical protein
METVRRAAVGQAAKARRETEAMSDTRYVGFDGKRLRWVEKAISETEKWAKETTDDAKTEMTFSRPGDFDMDAAIDSKRAVEGAKETLRALEAEREGILARQALIEKDVAGGKYDDDYS